jgi:transcriptional regulator with XRE-family HTH domain
MSKLKKMREKRGLRQLDLAKKADVSLTWIWVLENTFSDRVSRDIKKRVARALNCPYEEIFPERAAKDTGKAPGMPRG